MARAGAASFSTNLPDDLNAGALGTSAAAAALGTVGELLPRLPPAGTADINKPFEEVEADRGA